MSDSLRSILEVVLRVLFLTNCGEAVMARKVLFIGVVSIRSL